MPQPTFLESFRHEDIDINQLHMKLQQLELTLTKKADHIVTKQLIEHHHELEEIRSIIQELTAKVDLLTNQPPPVILNPPPVVITTKPLPPRRRKRTSF